MEQVPAIYHEAVKMTLAIMCDERGLDVENQFERGLVIEEMAEKGEDGKLTDGAKRTIAEYSKLSADALTMLESWQTVPQEYERD